MILAVVGSTLLAGNPKARIFIAHAFRTFQPDGFTSGGAEGIDSMAERYARETWGLPDSRIFIYRPRIHQWAGPDGFRDRNLKIAQTCDALVRIVSDRTTTYGSGWTRDRVRELGKPTADFVVWTNAA